MITMTNEEIVNVNDLDIPEMHLFRDYEYSLWWAGTEEWYARTEAHGVRDGYCRRMYGHTKATVKKWVIDGKTVWCVYVR